MKRDFPQLFWGLVALAALIAAQAVQLAQRSGDEISVTGSVRQSTVSDVGSVALTVTDTQTTAQAA